MAFWPAVAFAASARVPWLLRGVAAALGRRAARRRAAEPEPRLGAGAAGLRAAVRRVRARAGCATSRRWSRSSAPPRWRCPRSSTSATRWTTRDARRGQPTRRERGRRTGPARRASLAGRRRRGGRRLGDAAPAGAGDRRARAPRRGRAIVVAGAVARRWSAGWSSIGNPVAPRRQRVALVQGRLRRQHRRRATASPRGSGPTAMTSTGSRSTSSPTTRSRASGADNFFQDYLAARRQRRDAALPAQPRAAHAGADRDRRRAAAARRVRRRAGRGVAGDARGATRWPRRSRAARCSAFVYWVVHGMTDWFWEWAGLGAPAFALLGLACALAPRRAAATRTPSAVAPAPAAPRLVLVAGGAALVLAALVLAGPWLAERDVERGGPGLRHAPVRGLLAPGPRRRPRPAQRPPRAGQGLDRAALRRPAARQGRVRGRAGPQPARPVRDARARRDRLGAGRPAPRAALLGRAVGARAARRDGARGAAAVVAGGGVVDLDVPQRPTAHRRPGAGRVGEKSHPSDVLEQTARSYTNYQVAVIRSRARFGQRGIVGERTGIDDEVRAANGRERPWKAHAAPRHAAHAASAFP